MTTYYTVWTGTDPIGSIDLVNGSLDYPESCNWAARSIDGGLVGIRPTRADAARLLRHPSEWPREPRRILADVYLVPDGVPEWDRTQHIVVS